MFSTYLNTEPFSKFILIKDNLEERGTPILNYVVNKHILMEKYEINYFAYEGIFRRTKEQFNTSNINFYDCISDMNGWKERYSISELKKFAEDPFLCVCPCPDVKPELFLNFSKKITNKCVVIIDSLAHLLYDYGFKNAYEMLTKLKNHHNVLQIVCLLHQDILEDVKVIQYFEHLATFHLTLEAKRIIYTYKKASGKIIRQIENYRFENGNLISKQLKKLDPASLIRENPEVKPDSLTTFKISLEDAEKKSRDNLILPYLPKDQNDNTGESEGQIIYQLDEVDDWDEEDPDDDLDI